MLEKLYEFTVTIYQRVFKCNSKGWTTTKEDLKSYPLNTLGNQLYKFLESNKFELQAKLESHDVFHVKTKTGVTVPEEISMQFLLISNGKKSVYGFTTAILGFIIIPEGIQLYKKAFKLGKKLQPFHAINFEHNLQKPLIKIQNKIFGNVKEKIATSNLLTTF